MIIEIHYRLENILFVMAKQLFSTHKKRIREKNRLGRIASHSLNTLLLYYLAYTLFVYNVYACLIQLGIFLCLVCIEDKKDEEKRTILLCWMFFC